MDWFPFMDFLARFLINFILILIGAWWIGFLSCSIVAVIASIPILMFARELPEAQKHRRKDINQV